MKFGILLAIGVLLPLVFPACSSGPKARLVDWKDTNFTVCCMKKECNDKDWASSAKVYCTGSVSLVGGKITEGVSGYSTEKEKDNTFNLTPVMKTQSCRIFKCDGNIIPPKG